MNQNFAGKTIAITGAAGGIGRALSHYFAERGALLALLDFNASVMAFGEELISAGHSVQTATVDIGSADEVAAAFEVFGHVDILINNAGISRSPTLGATTPDVWSTDVNTNLNGAYNCSHAVLPQMSARRSGAIVSVGSVNGLYALGDPAYSAAKAGLIAFTKAVAMEYGQYGIRANLVMPGTVRTPLWDARSKKDPEVLRTLERWYPLGRIVEPLEVAKVIAFLASDDASAITGAAIPVDCGLSAGNIVMTRELTLEEF